MTGAKNVDMSRRGVEMEAEVLDYAWRCADLRQSKVQFCFILLCCCFFYLYSSLRYTKGESGMEPATVFIFGQLTPHDASLSIIYVIVWFDLIAIPPSLPLNFCSPVAHSLCLILSTCLYCLALRKGLPFLRNLLKRMPYAYYM